MGIKCAIVGLPNVGKSSLFNALTQSNSAANNYPFCTIEPNVGMVTVPETRLDCIAKLVQPQKIVPTCIEFVDIAGLVKGAAQGEGLGNQFLSAIRETDAIIHVVRCFHDDNIIHVGGAVNPLQDIATVYTELALADLQSVEKRLVKIAKQLKSNDKEAKTIHHFLQKAHQHLSKGLAIRTLSDLSAAERDYLKTSPLLTAKPIIYLANVDEHGFTDNPLLTQVSKLGESEHAQVIAICIKIEVEIAKLTSQEKAIFLHDLGLTHSALQRVIGASYALLDLMTYFTAGKKELRAWTILRGTSAKSAAGVIHSDFERGFIRAEVISYHDFIQYHGEQGAKVAGRWRLEGKNYLVQDGDIMHFRFNT